MIPLFDIETFNCSKISVKFPLQCKQCENTFYKRKSEILRINNPKYSLTYDFCTQKCKCIYDSEKTKINLICPECNMSFRKSISTTKKAKNHFCSRSCAASYNNKHKSKGTRRSKLEIWLEQQLTNLYPNLHIDYNKKDAIGSELDIYIPSLNIAFELNGIFHYEPIYGVDKLQQIQENDASKSKACHDAKIDLCVIDTSTFGHFKLQKATEFLNIILTIINQRTFNKLSFQ